MMIIQILSIIKLFFTSLFGGSSGMRKYFLYTAGLAIAITALFFYLINLFIGQVKVFILDLIPYDWTQGSWVISLLLGISSIFIFIAVFKYIIIVLLSPLLSYISEKAEMQETGNQVESSFSFLNATSRSIRINTRNMLKELILSVFLFVLSFIPGVNFISIPLLFMVQAYFAGFGIMDFYLERHHEIKESIGIVYKNKWAAMSLGSLFLIVISIPILGAILAPYYATIVGTRYFASMSKDLVSHS